MNLLLTNDDGYGQKGLVELAAELSKEHNVYILAPSSNRSGVSNSITMGHRMELVKMAENAYTCSGNPADCVVTGLMSDLFGVKFDAVVAGINFGANIGTDIVYSGTCSAARVAVMYKVPGLSVSLEHEKGWDAEKEDYDFKALAVFIRKNLSELLGYCKLDLPSKFVNVNAMSFSPCTEYRLTKQLGVRSYNDTVKIERDGDSLTTILLPGVSETSGSKDSDYAIAQEGFVAVSVIYAENVNA